MRALWNRAAIGWGCTFHPGPLWPVHGHYCCPACSVFTLFRSNRETNLARGRPPEPDPSHQHRGFVELAFRGIRPSRR